MRVGIAVDASGPRDHLRQMSARAASPRPLMTLLARDLEDYEKEAFSTRGFGTWPADDSDTVDQKGSSRVLVDTGGLLRQLTSARIMGETVIVDEGSHFEARFLRDGDRGMPRRNPAPKPTSSHVQKWADRLLRFIVTGRS